MVRADSRPLGPFSVSTVGFGTMRLTGPNALGPPKDRSQALAVLRQAVNLGVDHIDTAQFYGPTVVNELIRQALHPYPSELILVSKVGARRDRHGGVLIDDAPDRLRRGIEDNLRTLNVDVLPVVNLRRMRATGPDALFDDQLDAMITAREDGLIKAIGLSNVTSAHLLHALRFTEVACVQNTFHLKSRQSQPVLQECTRRNITFVPVAPLGFGASAPIRSSASPRSSGKQRDCISLRRRSSWPGPWPPHRMSCSSPAQPLWIICGRIWPPRASTLTLKRFDGFP